MTPLMLLALIAGLPVLLAIVLRVNSLYLFLSIAVGYLLSSSIGETTALTVRTLASNSQPELLTNLVLFALPIALALIWMRKSLPAKQLPMQLTPLLGNGLLILVLGIPLMSAGTRGTILANSVGDPLYQATDLIVAIVAVIHFLLMLATGKSHDKKSKHR